jgi:hypothetical protein
MERDKLESIIKEAANNLLYWNGEDDRARKIRTDAQIALFLSHPGLCFYGNHEGIAKTLREKISETPSNDPNKKSDLDALEHFRYTLFYPFPVGANSNFSDKTLDGKY